MAKGTEKRQTITLFYLELLLGHEEGQGSTAAVGRELICERRDNCHRGVDENFASRMNGSKDRTSILTAEKCVTSVPIKIILPFKSIFVTM